MSKISDSDKLEYGTIQNRDWHKKNIFVFLNQEFYPDELVTDRIFILSKKEIAELNAKTERRIRHYNKNVNPVGWAGFTERAKVSHQVKKVMRDNRKKGAMTIITTQVNPKVFKHTKKEQKAFLKECDKVLK